MIKPFPFVLSAVFLLGVAQMAPAAFTVTFKDGNITNNTSEDGANYRVTVYGKQDAGYTSLANDQVVFQFSVGSGESGKISEIYFQDGTLLGISAANVNNVIVDGVNFEADGTVTPKNLPGGSTLSPTPFLVTKGFVAESTNETVNAVAAGESTGIKFTLKNGLTYSDVVAALLQGASEAVVSGSGNNTTVDMHGGLRIGIHVRDAQGSNSDSFINEIPSSGNGVPTTVVPTPPAVVLALSGLVGVGLLGGLRRVRRWVRSPAGASPSRDAA